MSWTNISRNISTDGGNAVGFLIFQSHLYSIVNPGTSPYILRKHLDPKDALNLWDTPVALPYAPSYNITGYAEDVSNNLLYISNAATGQIYTINTLDGTGIWGVAKVTLGGYVGVDAQIKQLIYYNNNVYLAHRGGVSVFNHTTNSCSWDLVGDFKTGFNGVGDCYGFAVLNHELYVTVSFGDISSVYKYNSTVTSTSWIKVAEFSSTSSNPQYLTSRDNILYSSCDDIDQNVFSSLDIDSTLTGQPRFTTGWHLAGVPSSILNYSEDNMVYATAWNVGHETETSNAYTNNLVVDVKQFDPTALLSGETWFTQFNYSTSTKYATAITQTGGFYFNSNNPKYSDSSVNGTLNFSIISNTLKLLPNQTYTIVFDLVYTATIDVIEQVQAVLDTKGKEDLNKSAKCAITLTLSGGITRTYRYTGSALFGTSKIKVTLSFNSNDLLDVTNTIFTLTGVVRFLPTYAKVSRYPDALFIGNATVSNIRMYRGEGSYADATYLTADYIYRSLSSVPTTDRSYHNVEFPSPPDEWFAKFPGVNPVLPGVDGKPSSVPKLTPIIGQGGDLDLGDLGRDWGKGTNEGTNNKPLINDTDNTISATSSTRLARLLVTNGVKLTVNSIYRVHSIINRVAATGQGKPLIVKVSASISTLPGYTGTIAVNTIKPLSIEWEFSTAGVSQSDLDNVKFQILMYEEDISPSDAATVYISDINILGKVTEIPVNSIFRYDGDTWDDSISKLSNDNGIVTGHPYGLIQFYENIRSLKNRLYCISSGKAYVWNDGDPSDPYGVYTISTIPRIIIVW